LNAAALYTNKKRNKDKTEFHVFCGAGWMSVTNVIGSCTFFFLPVV